MATSHKYHMRIAVESLGMSHPLVLGGNVCIDVVLRSTDKNDIDIVANEVRAYLDTHVSGHWAGIGRGEYIERDITLA